MIQGYGLRVARFKKPFRLLAKELNKLERMSLVGFKATGKLGSLL
jgi:hypothetical protein